MPRPRTQSDDTILTAALDLMRAGGPRALTFAAVARACGLSPATLVQRFGTLDGMKQQTLLLAWDQLDARTERLAAAVPATPRGAIELLAGLSGDYGDIDSYAEGLLMLREDLRDPALRARGAAWRDALAGRLDACLAGGGAAPGTGLMMAAQWQGLLLWWSFDPQGPLAAHVARGLERFVARLAAPS
jgi:AcrR family transcriptional regulator